MNDQLQTALAAILGKATDAVMAGVSFLQAELPDVVRQLLLWKLVEGISLGAVAGIFLAVWGIVGFRVTKRISDASDSWERGWPWFVYGMISIIPVGALSTAFVSNVLNALQIWLAPKIYLIEYAAKLAK